MKISLLIFAAVFPVLLTGQEQPAKRGEPGQDFIFRKVLRTQGDEGIHTCRIPGLATSTKGTLLSVFDLRHKSAADLPADIDVGLMRSTDNGDTWSKVQRILDMDSRVPGSMGNGVGDPAILVDTKTGAIFVLALHSLGNRAWHGSGPGLRETETGQLVMVKSTDDGLTWTKPTSLTMQVKHPAWHLCFNGPGSGICMRDGTLVFPAQYRDLEKAPRSCFLFSTDHGQSWDISPPAMNSASPPSESAVVELDDGSLLLSMRDEQHGGERLWARWEWKDRLENGKWSIPWHHVPDPTCMASLIRHPDGLLLFSNPDSRLRRESLTIRASNNNGLTWPTKRLLDPRPCAYSCMTILRDGRIGILYETGDKSPFQTLTFARFPVDWVLNDSSDEEPGK